MSTISPPPRPHQKILIKSKFLKMPYTTQIIDVANQLAKHLYGAKNLASILGKPQNVLVSRLRNVKVHVVMPQLPPAQKPDKTCRIRRDKSGKMNVKGKISTPCTCSKCRPMAWRTEQEQVLGDEKTIRAFNAVKNMIRHGIQKGVDIVF